MDQTIREGLTFDDVLLVPQYSSVLPQQVDLTSSLTPEIKLSIPLLSAAMDTVTESELAIALARAGGLGVIHRNLSIEQQSAEIAAVKAWALDTAEDRDACVDSQGRLRAGAALGTGPDTLERASALVAAGADVLVVDSAHGHSQSVLRVVAELKKRLSGIAVIGGNVATAAGTEALIDAGADIVKVGIGSGASCTTRLVAGVGVPQLTAVMDAAEAGRKAGIAIISDGGLRYSGDIAKSLAAGAAAVMLGRLLAGTDESPGGDIFSDEDGRGYMAFRGMGSEGAMRRGSSDRYFQSDEGPAGVTTAATKLVPEGIEGRVPSQGPISGVLYQLTGGLRSAMGYCGAADIKALQDKAMFMRVTASGALENHPRGVAITKDAPNYAASQ